MFIYQILKHYGNKYIAQLKLSDFNFRLHTIMFNFENPITYLLWDYVQGCQKKIYIKIMLFHYLPHWIRIWEYIHICIYISIYVQIDIINVRACSGIQQTSSPPLHPHPCRSYNNKSLVRIQLPRRISIVLTLPYAICSFWTISYVRYHIFSIY